MNKKFQIFILVSFLISMFVLPFFGFAADKDPNKTYNPYTTIPKNAKERCARLKDLLKIEIKNPEFAKDQPSNLNQGLPNYCTADSLLTEIINKFLIFSGIIATIFIMYGGGMYLLSAGNEERSESAKKVLVNSVIGLVVIVMAFAIVKIVVNTIASPNSGSSGGAGDSASAGSKVDSRGGSADSANAGNGVGNKTGSAGTPSLDVSASKIGNLVSIGNINNGKANVSIVVKRSDWDSLNHICTTLYTAAPQNINASLSIKVNGNQTGFFKLNKNPTSYSGSANVDISSYEGLPVNLEVEVCNVLVRSEILNVVMY